MTGRGQGEAPETAGGPARHTPVLLAEVLDALSPIGGERYIDCTFGAGGYTRAILGAADSQLLALDRDPLAATIAADLKTEFPNRFRFEPSTFGALGDVAESAGFVPADAVIFDLGVSSMQIDEPERGFSFMRDGPLDMRMSDEGLSAADVVNRFDEADIAEILFRLGEERRSRAIARAIVKQREQAPITRTLELAELIQSVLGRRHDDPKHPATRSFQALRLFVNDELGELVEGLAAAERILAPGGRLIVVTFHSLEDRIVKNFLTERSGAKGRPSRHLPDAGEDRSPSFSVARRKPVDPSAAEIAANPRARSARLRAAVRTDAPAWPLKPDEIGLPQLKGASTKH
ncbi:MULTISPECIES: 16S rRNA (cytosine(1402)-N(4))-methyltransferase RsmH [Rhodomicrobium]|uniref:16S rRNA (cytosine(1402)-N(4))-methyltransferase RsmH n=1 Tax=Rhodomicrobium TaxID=1068 RepID=UPI000B4BE7C4|nr:MULTISPECIES: 16S rRNA (cytosine(1402)-N(4))-methyltransferase RsmH [Rhodomicrobium]